jgi:hypothetical protein
LGDVTFVNTFFERFLVGGDFVGIVATMVNDNGIFGLFLDIYLGGTLTVKLPLSFVTVVATGCKLVIDVDGFV